MYTKYVQKSGEKVIKIGQVLNPGIVKVGSAVRF